MNLKLKALFFAILICSISTLSSAQTYDYLPGDANMACGNWPPTVSGADIAYLTNFTRGFTEPCLIDGFYAAGDVNGSCEVNGSDVTYLVVYLRGLISQPWFCEFSTPNWLTWQDVPTDMPANWPICEGATQNPPGDSVYLWYGNIDGSPINTRIGENLVINVFIQTTGMAYIGTFENILGIDSDYIDSFLPLENVEFPPLDQWDIVSVADTYESPPGQLNQTIIGIAQAGFESNFWIHAPTPEPFMTIMVHTAPNIENEWQTASCLSIGENAQGGRFGFSDSLGGYEYNFKLSFSPVYFEPLVTGSIQGMVTNTDLEPIDNVQIMAFGPTPVSAYTNEYGYYSLTALQPGSYTLDYTHSYYPDTTIGPIQVDASIAEYINVELTDTGSTQPVNPGWLYQSPRTVRDTINANATSWSQIMLTDPDPTYSVTVDSIKASASWIEVDNWYDRVVSPLDTVYLPVMFNMAGYSDIELSGDITIFSSSRDTTNIIPCEIIVTDQPALGPVISVESTNLLTLLEPNVSGEIKISVYNNGDLPLEIDGTTNSASWLYPIVNTGVATPDRPLDLVFAVNTSGYENVNLNDIVNIFSNAINEPTLPVHIDIEVAPDNVAGSNPLGDVNYDGYCNEADVDYLVDYLYGIGPAPCMPAGDINGDSDVDIYDVMYLIAYLRGNGAPPVNTCGISDNYRQHELNQQIFLPRITVAHRGDWIYIPVYIWHQQHLKSQLAFDLDAGIADDITVEDVSGIGFETYAKIESNTARDADMIIVADSVGPAAPVDLNSLTHIYNLHLHISDNAPIGRYDLTPTGMNTDRGPTLFFQDDNFTTFAPMFYSSAITIRPKVILQAINGIPDVIYADQLRSLPVGLTITSDADVDNSMNLFIVDLTSGDTVYIETVSQHLMVGTHDYGFTVDWEIETPGNYFIGAGIESDLDEANDNYLGRYTYVTDHIQVGLPLPEGFGGGLATDILTANYSTNNKDGFSPTWAVATGMSYDGDNNQCLSMPAYNKQGGHDDWLLFGPMTGVSLTAPEIHFWETAFNWNDTAGGTHEFYFQYTSDFDIGTALAAGPVETHTTANHILHDLVWKESVIQLPDSVGLNDKIYFAWRYVGDVNRPKKQFDTWRVDYIYWAEGGDYEYVPGDANMYIGTWPPVIIGSDVTYLVNYFRSLQPPCLLDTHYAAADANGDCKVIGSDVTKLVSYFRGLTDLSYCPNYLPKWSDPEDAAADPEPVNWPNCNNSPSLSIGGLEQPVSMKKHSADQNAIKHRDDLE